VRFVRGPMSGRYPEDPGRPARGFRGKVDVDFTRCTLDGACVDACPTPALRIEGKPGRAGARLMLDHGHCVFCGLCEEACDNGAIRLTAEFELAVTARPDLISTAIYGGRGDAGTTTAKASEPRRRSLLERLGRPLQLVHIDAGSCNGCELELAATTSPRHDLARLGVELTASPHAADGLLVTGPVTPAMAEPLRSAHAALRAGARVLAVGACAIGGGIFRAAEPALVGLEELIPVDVWIPGCPPRPEAILHGLLVALGRATPSLTATTWRGDFPASDR